ncbi:DNA-binding transcriptional regulator YbjK [Nocardioides cavernae]|uniref:DNA-binding transcriptional regulator YbjK n=1 Tax=Nocardioides cavernae TaxID=1921566 RepID=A0A7Y9KT29_9ACTN|nr:TetR/AcrR family transcriptional regulator [Nocardioides cavernae]NYE38125.1 DNA-binding transcriptional regulator YbjK [Nocardioides cavernae]
METRRPDIADAAIRVIARDGLRGLTHRAVDRELAIAIGSTSYYARTRRDLVELVVRRLSERTAGEVTRSSAPLPRTSAGLAKALAAVTEQVVAREADSRARLALAVDLVDEPDLHSLMTDGAPVRELLLSGARAGLEALGVDRPDEHALDLVTILDGLVYHRLAGPGVRGARADAERMLTAYLTGLPRAG